MRSLAGQRLPWACAVLASFALGCKGSPPSPPAPSIAGPALALVHDDPDDNPGDIVYLSVSFNDAGIAVDPASGEVWFADYCRRRLGRVALLR